jgi:hypothetical protein
MHVDGHVAVEYLQIFTASAPHQPLEISGDHFLYLNNGKVIRAQDVQIGDVLKGSTADTMTVTEIKQIQRLGLYAPATEDGKIWVSGVSASSYISLLDSSIVSHNVHATLSHMALAPLRMACNRIGSFSVCQIETYSEDGYSMNLLPLIQFGHYFMGLTIPVQMLTSMFFVPLLLVVTGVIFVIKHSICASMLTVGLVAIAKMKMISKVAK